MTAILTKGQKVSDTDILTREVKAIGAQRGAVAVGWMLVVLFAIGMLTWALAQKEDEALKVLDKMGSQMPGMAVLVIVVILFLRSAKEQRRDGRDERAAIHAECAAANTIMMGQIRVQHEEHLRARADMQDAIATQNALTRELNGTLEKLAEVVRNMTYGGRT